MIPTKLDKTYWEERYNKQQTGWDVGTCTTPLKDYFDQLNDKSIKILIPGAGNAYEAEYLHHLGFKNVYVCDISEAAIESFKKRCTDFPEEHLILGDFYAITEKFDLIIEQTFFCALEPEFRENYLKKTADLLNNKGKLVGLLFNTTFEKAGPPFGGSKEEYLPLFSKYLNLKTMETAYNSIKPRAGTELFVIASKKN
jgi:SAM-dependent methyltransferase